MATRDSTPVTQAANVAELIAQMVATDDANTRAQVAGRMLAALKERPASADALAPEAWREEFIDEAAASVSELAQLLARLSYEDSPPPEALRCMAIRLQSLADVVSMAADETLSRQRLAGMLYGPVHLQKQGGSHA